SGALSAAFRYTIPARPAFLFLQALRPLCPKFSELPRHRLPDTYWFWLRPYISRSHTPNTRHSRSRRSWLPAALRGSVVYARLPAPQKPWTLLREAPRI